MKVGGTYHVYSRRNPWPGTAGELEVSAEALTERAGELARLAPGAFPEAAQDPAVRELGSDLPDRLAGLVADRGDRCLELCR